MPDRPLQDQASPVDLFGKGLCDSAIYRRLRLREERQHRTWAGHHCDTRRYPSKRRPPDATATNTGLVPHAHAGFGEPGPQADHGERGFDGHSRALCVARRIARQSGAWESVLSLDAAPASVFSVLVSVSARKSAGQKKTSSRSPRPAAATSFSASTASGLTSSVGAAGSTRGGGGVIRPAFRSAI
jgi:hypothetical protein